MSIATDVKVKNLEILVNRLERTLSELKAQVDALTPSGEKVKKAQPWTSQNLRPS